MTTTEHMQQTVDRYLAAINAGDMDAVIALYAEDASVEDPAGTEPKRGADILQFYKNAFAGGAKVKLTGAVRLSAKAAAFPFRAEITRTEGPTIIVEVIDVFEFDDAGKIARMTAYFGPANISVKEA